jgi:hypothetical protein
MSRRSRNPGPGRTRAPHVVRHHLVKLGKALLLMLLALGVWQLSDRNLPALFRQLLLFLHLDPEKQFFVDLGLQLSRLSAERIQWVAAGTVFYSLFPWRKEWDSVARRVGRMDGHRGVGLLHPD